MDMWLYSADYAEEGRDVQSSKISELVWLCLKISKVNEWNESSVQGTVWQSMSGTPAILMMPVADG